MTFESPNTLSPEFEALLRDVQAHRQRRRQRLQTDLADADAEYDRRVCTLRGDAIPHWRAIRRLAAILVVLLLLLPVLVGLL